MPASGAVSLTRSQREVCAEAAASLDLNIDPLLAAEQLRSARRGIAALLGVDAPEAMLDALFGRFCIGK